MNENFVNGDVDNFVSDDNIKIQRRMQWNVFYHDGDKATFCLMLLVSAILLVVDTCCRFSGDGLRDAIEM